MSNWDYVNKIPVTHDYRGQLSVVRRLRLQWVGDVPRLCSTPLAAQNTVFDQTISGPSQMIAEGSDYIWPTGAGAIACRIDFTLNRVGATWPSEVVLSVRRGEGYSTQIAFSMQDNIVSLKRDTSGPNAPDVDVWRKDREVACDFSGGIATISLFVDSGSVETFLNDGATTMSELITAPLTATGIALSTTGGSAKISDVGISYMS